MGAAVAPNPFVSIVTVVRNDEEGLLQTRRSIKIQTCHDFEWIIIDGASTDRTGEIVANLLNLGEARGISERDNGIYDAMNKGLVMARGAYVLFLNAGDVMHSNRALADARARIIESNIDIAFFGSIMMTGRRSIPRPARNPRYLWHGQPGLHQATFFNRRLHQQILFDPTFRVCGDYDVLARFKSKSAIMRSFPEVFSINKFDSVSTSGKMKIRLMREALSVQRKVLKLSPLVIGASVVMRGFNSLVLKIITRYDDRMKK